MLRIVSQWNSLLNEQYMHGKATVGGYGSSAAAAITAHPTLHINVHMLTGQITTDTSLACTMLRTLFGYPTKNESYGSGHSLP
jgi:hypothetical protein